MYSPTTGRVVDEVFQVGGQEHDRQDSAHPADQLRWQEPGCVVLELRIVAPGDGFAGPREIEIELTPLGFRVAAGETPIPRDAFALMPPAARIP